MTWRNPINCADYEEALDSGCLFVTMAGGAWWQCRRNGKTQRWVKEPDRFRIPIKFGFRGYGAITHADPTDNFRIAESRAEAEAA